MRAKIHYKTGLAFLAVAISLFIGSTVVSADPNPHFGPLISELEARSAVLNPEIKDEAKLQKALDKLIAGFYKKPSIRLDKDLQLAGKAAKKLLKMYPGEFASVTSSAAASATASSGNLSAIIESLLIAFDGDMDALLTEAQNQVDSAFEGKCKEKAQQILDQVAEHLALADAAPTLADKVKILVKAAKTLLKGEKAVLKAIECLPGGDNWYTWTLSMLVDGAPVAMYHDARTGMPDDLGITYFNSGGMFFFAHSEDGSKQLNMSFFVGNPGGPRVAIPTGSYTEGMDVYTITGGSVVITKFPKSLPNRLTATFNFTASGPAGTVDVTGGTFSIWVYPIF